MESKDEVVSTGGREKETEAASREAERGKEKEVEEEKKTSATEKEPPDEVKGEESDSKNDDGRFAETFSPQFLLFLPVFFCPQQYFICFHP